MSQARLTRVDLPEFGVPSSMPVIPMEVYEKRVDRLRGRMSERGLDSVVVYADREHSANISYLTGFDPRFEEAILVVGPDDAPAILASMLSAGLDGNAVRWGKLLEEGSEGWGQLIVAAPSINGQVSAGALSTFNDSDDSEEARKSGFLLAGLAGLGRISPDTARDFAGDLDIDLYRASRWSRLIDQAAEVNNVTLVVLLAGVGMQGDGWDRMTPRHLYHIVAALNRVGLNAEARMIAAEAVARG